MTALRHDRDVAYPPTMSVERWVPAMAAALITCMLVIGMGFVIRDAIRETLATRATDERQLVQAVQAMLREQSNERDKVIAGLREQMAERAQRQQEAVQTMVRQNGETLYKVDSVAKLISEIQVALARQESLATALDGQRVEIRRISDKLDQQWQRLREVTEHLKALEKHSGYILAPWRE